VERRVPWKKISGEVIDRLRAILQESHPPEALDRAAAVLEFVEARSVVAAVLPRGRSCTWLVRILEGILRSGADDVLRKRPLRDRRRRRAEQPSDPGTS
jgi:uncharacterized Fe-S cluster-containing protein